MTHRTMTGFFAALAVALVPLAGCEEEQQIEQPAEATEAELGAQQPAEPAEQKAEPAAVVPEEAHGSYEIDDVHSSVVFAGKHFDVSYTYGMFPAVTGSFDLKKDPSASSVKVEIAADSLFTANRKRDDDLKGPDFLNVKQFPKITFESTKVEAADEGYEVTGDLTLRGKTQSVTLTMEHVGSGTIPMDQSYRTGFHGETSISRNDFGVSGMPPAVGEEIGLVLSIEGIKQ